MDKELKKEFEKQFIRKNSQTGEYKMGWFLKDYTTGKAMMDFIEKALANQAKKMIGEFEGWEEWQCENPKCKAKYAEYVNGCPRCETGKVDGSYSVYGKSMTLSTAIKIIKKYA